MITWWMKLGGNRPPGDNPLLFSISGTAPPRIDRLPEWYYAFWFHVLNQKQNGSKVEIHLKIY